MTRCSVVQCVSRWLCALNLSVVVSPPSVCLLMNMNRLSISLPARHIFTPAPPSKSTSLSAVTRRYQRQPGKRLWRSNQLWLNTECTGSHYSKSRAARALTTIDCLNIACIGCRSSCAHLLWVSLRRQEVDCPPLVYWYFLSFMMTGTIFEAVTYWGLFLFCCSFCVRDSSVALLSCQFWWLSRIPDSLQIKSD